LRLDQDWKYCLIDRDNILPDNARKGCHEYGLLLLLEENVAYV